MNNMKNLFFACWAAGWKSGLYVLRVIVGGEVVATQKIHVK